MDSPDQYFNITFSKPFYFLKGSKKKVITTVITP